MLDNIFYNGSEPRQDFISDSFSNITYSENDYEVFACVFYFDTTKQSYNFGGLIWNNGDDGITLVDNGFYVARFTKMKNSPYTVFLDSVVVPENCFLLADGQTSNYKIFTIRIASHYPPFMDFEYCLSFNFYDNGFICVSSDVPIDNQTFSLKYLDNSNYKLFTFVRDSLYPNLSNSTTSVDLSEVNEQLDVIINSFSGLHGHIDSLNSSIPSGINGHIDSIQSQISGLSDSINGQFNGLTSQISSVIGDVDSSNLVEIIGEIENKIDNIDSIVSNFNSVSFVSLNGSSGSFKDKEIVTVSGYDDDFTVISSQMLKNDNYLYLIIYLLEDSEGKRMIAPATAVTLKQANGVN